ncbi:uncharacterized protein EDB93DRAFT_1113273 [Suillus bovinus]|uniref:uncharacterized protein n=1 Tax=Suillus bovinus TaxID=48563 RepID=UPI001B87B6F4|nr:uncharacterized protein EDB93DRAFT_1113273 [Suillus bovinus]KAG2160071.1 hypothetical protein EDB93DRAFT_1113273 [Suillus bovinus]
MNPFKKWFQKCQGEKKPSLKHSKSMPFRQSQASMFEPYDDPFKAVYYGKATPSKPSDIVYIKQAPGMPDTHPVQRYPDVHDHAPSRAHFDTRAHLPDSPPPLPPKDARYAIRNISDQQVARRHRTIQHSSSIASFSQLAVTADPFLIRKKRREVTADQAVANLLRTPDGRPPVFGSSRQAERVRAKSSAGRSYTPVPYDLLPTADGGPPVFGSSRQAERMRTKSNTGRSYTPVPYDLLPTADGGPPVFGSIMRAKSNTGRSYTPVPYDPLQTADGRPPVFGRSRQAERMRAKSNAGRSYTPVPPAPPVPLIPTTHYLPPMISYSVQSSRTNLNRSRNRR